jgi:hypothetical protein
VTERTREIGSKQSPGRDILSQSPSRGDDAVTHGRAIGVGLGSLGAAVIARLIEGFIRFSLWMVLLDGGLGRSWTVL